MKTQTKHSKISCDSHSKAHHFYYCLFTLSVDFMREWRSRKDLRVCFTSRNLKSLSPVDNRPITHSRRSILFHWFSNTRVGPKKSNKPRYQENQSPGLFPFPTYKKIFIQKGKHHYPTTTPHPISLPKKPSLFPVFPRHRTASLLTKLQ